MENKEPAERMKVSGKIEKKDVNPSGRGPKGYFFLLENGKEIKYTCWSQTIFDKFNVGDEVEIVYTIQENPYNGKIYYNKVVSTMNFLNKGNVQLTEKNQELLEEIGYKGKKQKVEKIMKSENGVIKMGGLYYRIKDIEVELLDNGESEID